jgi:Domain of unknown function (DUF4190)
MAIASLVLGIAGLPLFWAFGVPSLLAVVFGGVGIGQLNDPSRRQSGRPMAVWGIALGVGGLVGFVVFAALAASGVIDKNS